MSTETNLDISQLNTYPLADRPSKVKVSDLGGLPQPNDGIGDLLDRMPNQFAAVRLRQVRDTIVETYRNGKTVAFAIGGAVIKTGCAPYLIDLMERGVVKAVAGNGSVGIHDFELAAVGHTSEDVRTQLQSGQFGMARETADALAFAAERGADEGLGLAQALGLNMLDGNLPHNATSLFAQAARLGVTATLHVAVGADIVHMHPQCDGAKLGEATMIDFRKICEVVAGLEDGIWINLGSAVIMPEVFLKAISIARNLGHPLERATTVNMDMIQHYRGQVNVLDRPTSTGLALTGHHEIMVPLLHASVVAALEQAS